MSLGWESQKAAHGAQRLGPERGSASLALPHFRPSLPPQALFQLLLAAGSPPGQPLASDKQEESNKGRRGKKKKQRKNKSCLQTGLDHQTGGFKEQASLPSSHKDLAPSCSVCLPVPWGSGQSTAKLQDQACLRPPMEVSPPWRSFPAAPADSKSPQPQLRTPQGPSPGPLPSSSLPPCSLKPQLLFQKPCQFLLPTPTPPWPRETHALHTQAHAHTLCWGLWD